MNPFAKQKDWQDITDSPDARVMLECQKCGTIVTEGRYWPELKMLSWKCPCEHISKQRYDMDE